MGCKSGTQVDSTDTQVDTEVTQAVSADTQADTEDASANSTDTRADTEDASANSADTQTDTEDANANSADTQTDSEDAEAFSNVSEETGLHTNTTMRDITTMQLVRDMGLGINLGNTFEACGDWISKSSIENYEKAWGSPIITEKIIKGYADAGFKVLRIPVAWSNLMSEDGTYTINQDLMRNVQQTVDWTIDNGMYAIVNIHWDNGWFHEFPTKKEESMKKYTRIWTQISDTFRDYGDYLMFESLNEELGWQDMWNRWSGSTDGKAEAFALANEINQTFVDLVRASGGNNSTRHLLIAGYNTDPELTCDPLYVMPNDPAGHCAVSMHYYIPSTFAILDKDAEWGKARTTWGNEEDLKELEKNVNLMKTRFIDNGIPVIIGEYGCAGKNKTVEAVNYYLSTVSNALYKANMCPVLWSVTGDQYDRYKAEFTDKELLEQLFSVVE